MSLGTTQQRKVIWLPSSFRISAASALARNTVIFFGDEPSEALYSPSKLSPINSYLSTCPSPQVHCIQPRFRTNRWRTLLMRQLFVPGVMYAFYKMYSTLPLETK